MNDYKILQKYIILLIRLLEQMKHEADKRYK
jgi:hypothetical protein